MVRAADKAITSGPGGARYDQSEEDTRGEWRWVEVGEDAEGVYTPQYGTAPYLGILCTLQYSAVHMATHLHTAHVGALCSTARRLDMG